jgi:hypothetical protein
LQGLEARWNAAASPRAGLAVLVHVAKAALEAGDNQKAYHYALQALSIADAVAADRQRRGFKNPRRFEAFCRMVGGDLQQGGYPTSKPRARTLYYGRSQQSCYQAAKEETHNEFADFQRPYCAADEKTLAQLRRRMETG